jgi:hypothetical protein
VTVLHGNPISIKNSLIPLGKVYKAAVLEPDNARLEKSIAVVEKSLLLRLLAMSNRPANKIETKAIVDALRAMRNLKRERLGR